MARIRSIKPEYWKDGKIRRMSDSCALFFIGLWNFCDDEGKCINDSLELASNMPRFKSQHISKWIQTLFEVGSIQLSTDFKWISITNWNHQKIDKPRLPQVRKEEIEWIPIPTADLSANAQRMVDDSSTNVRRKDRIGSDRIGSDRIVAKRGTASSKKPQPDKTLGSKIFESYQKAFISRYGVEPPRSSKTNKNCQDLGTRLGEDAIEVVKFYVGHNKTFYVQACHPIGIALKDAEGLHTQWSNGKQVTYTEARAMENKQQTFNAFAKFLEPEEQK